MEEFDCQTTTVVCEDESAASTGAAWVTVSSSVTEWRDTVRCPQPPVDPAITETGTQDFKVIFWIINEPDNSEQKQPTNKKLIIIIRDAN